MAVASAEEGHSRQSCEEDDVVVGHVVAATRDGEAAA